LLISFKQRKGRNFALSKSILFLLSQILLESIISKQVEMVCKLRSRITHSANHARHLDLWGTWYLKNKSNIFCKSISYCCIKFDDFQDGIILPKWKSFIFITINRQFITLPFVSWRKQNIKYWNMLSKIQHVCFLFPKFRLILSELMPNILTDICMTFLSPSKQHEKTAV